jgi:hypothetical protein
MKNIGLFTLFCLFSGCMNTIIGGEAISLNSALNSKADGFSGIDIETGEKFRINSTKANDKILCRVVSIERSERFIVESFCKAKGGNWR